MRYNILAYQPLYTFWGLNAMNLIETRILQGNDWEANFNYLDLKLCIKISPLSQRRKSVKENAVLPMPMMKMVSYVEFFADLGTKGNENDEEKNTPQRLFMSIRIYRFALLKTKLCRQIITEWS